MENTRFKATYNGEVIGWYDTLEEAEVAVEAARKAEKDEDKNFRAWVQNKD